MGQISNSQNKSILVSNWIQLKSNRLIYFNKVTNQHIQKHQLIILSKQQLQPFIQRIHQESSYICRLIYFHLKDSPKQLKYSDNQQLKRSKVYSIYTDRMIQIKQWNKQKIIHVIQGFKRLTIKYGRFKVREGCVCENQRREVKVWVNQNPVSNFPVKLVQTEEDMIADFAALLVSRKQKIAKQLLDLRFFDQVIQHFNHLQHIQNHNTSSQAHSYKATNREYQQRANPQHPPQVNNFYNVFINSDNGFMVSGSLQGSRHNYAKQNQYGSVSQNHEAKPYPSTNSKQKQENESNEKKQQFEQTSYLNSPTSVYSKFTNFTTKQTEFYNKTDSILQNTSIMNIQKKQLHEYNLSKQKNQQVINKIQNILNPQQFGKSGKSSIKQIKQTFIEHKVLQPQHDRIRFKANSKGQILLTNEFQVQTNHKKFVHSSDVESNHLETKLQQNSQHTFYSTGFQNVHVQPKPEANINIRSKSKGINNVTFAQHLQLSPNNISRINQNKYVNTLINQNENKKQFPTYLQDKRSAKSTSKFNEKAFIARQRLNQNQPKANLPITNLPTNLNQQSHKQAVTTNTSVPLTSPSLIAQVSYPRYQKAQFLERRRIPSVISTQKQPKMKYSIQSSQSVPLNKRTQNDSYFNVKNYLSSRDQNNHNNSNQHYYKDQHIQNNINQYNNTNQINQIIQQNKKLLKRSNNTCNDSNNSVTDKHQHNFTKLSEKQNNIKHYQSDKKPKLRNILSFQTEKATIQSNSEDQRIQTFSSGLKTRQKQFNHMPKSLFSNQNQQLKHYEQQLKHHEQQLKHYEQQLDTNKSHYWGKKPNTKQIVRQGPQQFKRMFKASRTSQIMQPTKLTSQKIMSQLHKSDPGLIEQKFHTKSPAFLVRPASPQNLAIQKKLNHQIRMPQSPHNSQNKMIQYGTSDKKNNQIGFYKKWESNNHIINQHNHVTNQNNHAISQYNYMNNQNSIANHQNNEKMNNFINANKNADNQMYNSNGNTYNSLIGVNSNNQSYFGKTGKSNIAIYKKNILNDQAKLQHTQTQDHSRVQGQVFQQKRKIRRQLAMDYIDLFGQQTPMHKQKRQEQQRKANQAKKLQQKKIKQQQQRLLQSTSSKDLLILQKVQKKKQQYGQLKSDFSKLF